MEKYTSLLIGYGTSFIVGLCGTVSAIFLWFSDDVGQDRRMTESLLGLAFLIFVCTLIIENITKKKRKNTQDETVS